VPNTQLFHPDNETLIFGNVPEVNSRGILIPGGPIKLLKGRHNGPNRGFGAAHIWAEHSLEMAKHQCGNVDDVPRYVSLIIQTGTPLYFSGEITRTTRIMAVRALPGTAILEHRTLRTECFWSVVTAYSANKKHGTQVGSVL
jgi:hypothetical protein